MSRLTTTVTHDAGFDKPVELTEHKWWNSNTVRKTCIHNDWFTCGTNENYMRMLSIVDETEPTIENIFDTASCIAANSKHIAITDIMYILTKEAIYTTYEINGSDDV